MIWGVKNHYFWKHPSLRFSWVYIVLVSGSLQADGREPDWQLICDEAVNLEEAISPSAEMRLGDFDGDLDGEPGEHPKNLVKSL